MVARGWSEEDRRLYTLADNRLAEIAEWDPEMLRIEIGELREDFGIEDMGLIGFSADDLAEILPDALLEITGGLTDPDDVPEVPEAPVARPGDVWLLGKHRLLCGDSTVATDVETRAGFMKTSIAGVARPRTTSSRGRRIWRQTARPARRPLPISFVCSCTRARTG